ncbi:MAG: hypothetical protein U0821_20775 [Chloroflexota bacterium]
MARSPSGVTAKRKWDRWYDRPSVLLAGFLLASATGLYGMYRLTCEDVHTRTVLSPDLRYALHLWGKACFPGNASEGSAWAILEDTANRGARGRIVQIFEYGRYPYDDEVVRLEWTSPEQIVVTVAECDRLWPRRSDALSFQIAYQSDEGAVTHACDE